MPGECLIEAVVPSLDHDGEIVTDSTVITEYLDEIAPEESFTPASAVERPICAADR